MILLAAMLLATPPALPVAPAIANPAATYCLTIGGRLEIVDTPQGQTGYCILPDGTRIEEWTLFRRNMERQKASEKN